MLTPRNLNKCAVGQCKYAFITNAEGGIINDPVLLRLDENHFWLSLADSDVLLWAQGLAYNMGLNVEIKEPDVGPMQVQGPKSREVMTDLFGEEILEVPYYYMVHRELDGMELVISRTGYSGELGYELYLKNASRDGLKLWDRVLQAGEPHGISPIGPCHIRRIEGGILALGCDMWYDTNPYEVGYGYKWMVELEQEQHFVGREALKRISEEGVSRKLVGVELGGSNVGSYNDGSMIDYFPVHKHGERIGKVTSACYSPRLEKNIGFAMVPVEYSEIGIRARGRAARGDGLGHRGRPCLLQARARRADSGRHQLVQGGLRRAAWRWEERVYGAENRTETEGEPEAGRVSAASRLRGDTPPGDGRIGRRACPEGHSAHGYCLAWQGNLGHDRARRAVGGTRLRRCAPPLGAAHSGQRSWARSCRGCARPA